MHRGGNTLQAGSFWERNVLYWMHNQQSECSKDIFFC